MHALRSARILWIAAAAVAAGLAIAAATVAAPGPAPPASVARDDAPDLVLFNGKISTLDAADSTVQAIAIRDGKALATGAEGPIRALARPGTRLIDLNGRRVTPGLIDGHLHGIRNGYHCFTQAVRLDNVFSRAEALALYRAKDLQLADDRWIFTTAGWTVRQLDTPGMFTRAELDAAMPGNPAIVLGFDRGVIRLQVNSRALEVLGVPSADLATAGAAVVAQLNEQTIEQQAACLEDFVHAANGLGLTAWKDPEGNQQPFNPAGGCSEFAVDLHGHQAIAHLRRENRLDARVAFHLMNNFGGLETVLEDTRHAIGFVGDDLLRYLGVGEEVLCPGNQPPPDRAEYLAIARHLAANRISFENHASREATQAAILDAWEQANEVNPIAKLHWTIAHPGEDNIGPTPATLARAKALGIGMTPSDTGALGRGTSPPLRRILDSGVRMCLATDAMNVSPYPPFIVLWYAVSGNTLDPGVSGIPLEQRLTREQALRAMTANCAWNLAQEGRLGTLEPGKHADLIVHSRDYFTVPTDEIRSLRSVLTIVGGRIVSADAEFAGLDD